MDLDRSDIAFLEEALELAEQGRGRTSPNPIVGALVVANGHIVGRGFHAGAGLDHAEIVAMKDAVGPAFAGRLPGATVYVTLEPCCHHGRTPPCTDALLTAGVSRVVVASLDPSAKVDGRGIEQLRAGGVRVDVAEGALGLRARRQNGPFRKHVREGLPFVTYKYAMTIDGRVATRTGHSRWISGEESRRLVHQWRAWSDAVMVGAGTLRADDPLLTSREVECPRQPLRVVVDTGLLIRKESALVRSLAIGPVLVFCSAGVSEERCEEARSWGLDVVPIGGRGADGAVDLRLVCLALGERQVQSVLLEGGPRLAASFFSAGLIDKIAAFVAPVISGGRDAPGPLPTAGEARMDHAPRLQDVTVERLGADVLLTGYLKEAY